MAKPNPQTPPSKRDVKDATTIEPAALLEEFVRTPGDLAYWAEQYSQALEVQLTAKADRELAWEMAVIDIKKAAKAAAEAGTAGKMTEKDVEAAATTTPAYQAALRNEIQANVAKDRAGGILDAVKAKKDVCISLASHIRHNEEMDVYRNKGRR